MSLLTNEFDVRSVLHGQVSLAAVNQIYVIHERLQKSKDLYKACFENVYISAYLKVFKESYAAERDISVVKFFNVILARPYDTSSRSLALRPLHYG